MNSCLPAVLYTRLPDPDGRVGAARLLKEEFSSFVEAKALKIGPASGLAEMEKEKPGIVFANEAEMGLQCPLCDSPADLTGR